MKRRQLNGVKEKVNEEEEGSTFVDMHLYRARKVWVYIF